MADQLLFRGGNTASVAGSTVSNREIVIDTQTNQIVLGSAKKRTAMEGDDVSFEGIVATNPRTGTAASGTGGLTIHPSDTTVYYNFRVDQVDNDLRIDTNQGADKVKFDLSGAGIFSGPIYGSGYTNGSKNTAIGCQINTTQTTGFFIGSTSSSLNGNTAIKVANSSGTTTVDIKADGSADFAGTNLDVGNLKQASVRSSGLFLKDTGNASASNYNLKLDTNGSAQFAGTGCEINNAGRIKISRSTGTNKDGNAVFEVYNTNNVKTIELIQNGTASFAGQINGTTVGTSDQRFKENIAPANPQLGDVEALGAILKNFDWNADAPVNEEIRAQRQLGLIAQEAEEVCPSLTKTITRTKQGAELTPEQVVPAEYEEVVVPAVVDEEGEVVTPETTKQVLVNEEYVIPATYEELDDSYKGISHDALIMKLLGAVAELSAKVKALEA